MTQLFPLVSLIIRSRNDVRDIALNLDALAHQTYPHVELLFADCESTDGTDDVIRQYADDAHIVKIPPESYKPGPVLNQMVKLAKGEIVVFHNSDCIPLDSHYLANLVAPLISKTADATFANQHPRCDAEFWVRKDYERAFGDGSISKHWPNFFSLVSSAFVRQTLLDFPFSETLQYSEDVDWAFHACARGQHIVYVPDAHVTHSHNYTISEIRKRFWNEGVADFYIYGKVPTFWRGFLIPTLIETVRDAVYACRRSHPFKFLSMIRPRWTQRWNAYCGNRFAAEKGAGQ